MKKNKKTNTRKSNIFFKIVSWLLIISAVASTGFLTYFEVLPIIYLSIFIICVGLIIFLLFKLLNNKRLKQWINNNINTKYNFNSNIYFSMFLFIWDYRFFY